MQIILSILLLPQDVLQQNNTLIEEILNLIIIIVGKLAFILLDILGNKMGLSFVFIGFWTGRLNVDIIGECLIKRIYQSVP